MIAIVGAGAAGLATAIFAARRGVTAPILLFEGAQRPGAKILVSGGARCNVTNAVVDERDFSGSPGHLVKRVLRAFGVEQTVGFFRELGVALHEEEHGKLFPDANRSKVVLQALLDEVERRGVRLLAGERVLDVAATRRRLQACGRRGASTTSHAWCWRRAGSRCRRRAATASASSWLARFGHSVVPTTPALVPLVLAGSFHAPLSGVAHEVELVVRAAGQRPFRRTGSLLWTHFGISGPVVLDVSRAYLRAALGGAARRVLEANLLPGRDFAWVERELVRLAAEAPRTSVARALARRLPQAVAQAVAADAGCGETTLGRLTREERRGLVRGIVERPLPVAGDRGYSFAEVTAGGVPLAEVDTATMQSKRKPGLFLVGEMLDVDGRIGGFNFQWAWSSAWVAASGLARPL